MKEFKTSWLLISGFAGIVLGTIFANCMEYMNPSVLAVFAIDQYSITGWMIQGREAFSLYLLRLRGGQFLGMLFLGFLCNSVLLVFALTLFGGFIWGLVLSLETMRLGIHGLLLAVACFLPQSICYVLAIWVFLVEKEYLRQDQGISAGRIAKCILLPLCITMLGIVLEIWISPELVQWVLQ